MILFGVWNNFYAGVPVVLIFYIIFNWLSDCISDTGYWNIENKISDSLSILYEQLISENRMTLKISIGSALIIILCHLSQSNQQSKPFLILHTNKLLFYLETHWAKLNTQYATLTWNPRLPVVKANLSNTWLKDYHNHSTIHISMHRH